MTNNDYSVHDISDVLIDEIKSALKNVKTYGSVEIYVQKGCVTQITVRKISKLASNDVRKLAPHEVKKTTNGKSLPM